MLKINNNRPVFEDSEEVVYKLKINAIGMVQLPKNLLKENQIFNGEVVLKINKITNTFIIEDYFDKYNKRVKAAFNIPALERELKITRQGVGFK